METTNEQSGSFGEGNSHSSLYQNQGVLSVAHQIPPVDGASERLESVLSPAKRYMGVTTRRPNNPKGFGPLVGPWEHARKGVTAGF